MLIWMMRIKLLKLDNYTPGQLKQRLRPDEVEREFGLDKGTLSYMRECSRDTGNLRGPMFLKDANIILYQRKAVITWINNTTFSPTETQQTQQTLKSVKRNQA